MSMAASNANPVVDRAIRAARLEDAVYEEVARDQDATVQALLIVVATAILGGIGSLGAGGSALLAALIFAPLAWVLSSALAYFVGTRFVGASAQVDWLEVARALGFASAPGVFRFLGIIPVLGGLLLLAVGIWQLVAAVVALRASLQVTTGQAVVTMLLSMVIAWVVAALLLGALLGPVIAFG